MVSVPLIFILLMLAVLIGAGLYDIKTFTIPNIVPIIVLGLFVLAGIFEPLPLSQWGWQVLSALIAFLLGFGLFIFGLMGGGDVKLYGAIGLWILPSNILILTLMVTVTGTVLALSVLGYKVIKQHWFSETKTSWKNTYKNARHARIPYGPAITVGTILFWWVTTSS